MNLHVHHDADTTPIVGKLVCLEMLKWKNGIGILALSCFRA